MATRKAVAVTPRRFKPYPAYKDSGVEWLGEIPAGWEVKRRKYVAPARISELDVKPDDAVYVGLEHVESWTGRLLLENQPETVNSVVGSFRAGDVLFGKLRPYLAKVARPDFDGVCTSEILPLRPVPECSQSYVMYELLNAPYIRWLDSLTYGTKMPRVSPDQVASSFVGLPPLPEQRAIAAFLDRETARIDALVAKKERLIALLQEQRTALITRAVTKGLDPTVPMKDSGVEWLGEIPAHWGTRQGRYLYRALELAPHEGDGVVTAYRDGRVTLREKRRAEGYTFAIQEIGNQRVRVGDLVIQGMDAFAGAIGVSDSTGKCSPEYLVLDPIHPGTDNRYFAAALRLMAKRGYILVVCNAVRERAPRFRVPEFRNVFLPQPPEPEQRAIATSTGRRRASTPSSPRSARRSTA